MLKRWLQRNRPARAQRVAPEAEWLEQRLLYSADAASLLGVDTALLPAAEERSLDASFEYSPQSAPSTAAADVRTAFALSPLQFEADAGQLGEGVDFAASGLGYAVRLGGGNAELLLDGAEQPVTLTLVNGHAGAPQGQDLLATRSNSLVGTDSSKWITDIANYGSVLYRGVYDGVDVRYYGNQQQLEYDFIVAAGADASQLQLRFDGVDKTSIAANGDLLLRVGGTDRDIRFQAPVSYQDGPAGREAVQSRYELQPDGTVRIAVGDYDHSRALVVDPVLAHSSYFGENGNETALGVAVGADGSVYVTGHTTSTTGSFGTRMALGADASESYVAKFNADLSTLLWATRVGGSGADSGEAIAVDAAGNAIVTGSTRSTDFITTVGADQATRNGNLQDAFVYKLNKDGNGLVFSTYFGGAGNNDVGEGVALDAAGNIYVAGTVSAATDNAFLNKYTATGASLYKLQYGGSGADGATGLALDSAGNAYIVGNTLSVDNVTLNGAQTTRPGLDDAFLARYDSTGTLAYATYIGAGKADTATGVAVDDSGRAYVIGRTKDPSNSGFAATAGAFATTQYTHETGFLRVYDTTLTGAASLQYSTFVGGSLDAGGSTSSLLTDSPTGVAVSGGKVVVVGHTDTSDFPTTADAYSRTNTSGDTGFVMVLAPQGGGTRDLVYGSYFGTGLSTGGVAWSGSSFYLVGSTANSSIGVATAGAWKTTYGSGTEGVIAQFSGFGNVAPMLAGANNLNPQLEDAAAAGTLVSDLLAGRVSDGDAGALAGIAITGFDASQGSWQFSLDGGANWTTMTAPAAGSALVLNADALTRVRFAPAADLVGASSITFRAWDRSTGTAGSVVTMPTTGGSSAFSIGQATASVTVQAVNDAPVRTAGALGSVTAAEGSASVSLGLGAVTYAPGGGSDEAGQALRVVVTGLPGSVGTIQLADGTAVVAGGSYTVADLQTMRFLPGRFGTGSFTFTVQDDGGTADGGQDSLVQSMSLTVTNVAPVLTVTSVALPPQLEDIPGNGVTVADIVAGNVSDGGGGWGIAVVGMPNGNINGKWRYSLDGGTTWADVAGTTNNSLLLGPTARIRFESAAGGNVNGSIPGFTFRAWDGSTGVAGATASTGTTGGLGAFSSTTATVTLAITPVNDVPVRYNVGSGTFLPAPTDVTVNEGSAAGSLGLSYLQYISGYALDEYNTQALGYSVTSVPSAIGPVYLADGVTAVTAGSSYSLLQIQGMRFKPAAGVQTGTGTLTWAVKDDGGTANGGVDTLVDQVTINVRNVAPTLSGTNAFPAIPEDAQSAGMLVSDLVANQIVDPSNNTGIAVTAANGAGGGTWQWTRDGGTIWNSLSGASTTGAVLLQTGGQWRIRFLPAANWNSTLASSAPAITFRAWDRSTGTAGATADTTLNGGSTAFSSQTATATITVTAVSDAPVRSDVANNPPLAPLQVLDGAPLTSLGLAGITFGPGGGADEAGQTVSGTVTITSLPSGLGTVWLSDGTTQVVLGQSYTLTQLQGMKFLSSGVGQLGTGLFSFTVTDSGSTANGGSNTATFTEKVIVNRAPVLDGANSVLVVPEDFGGTGNAPNGNPPPWATSAQRAGVLVSDLVAGQIVDTTAVDQGIAIVAKAGSGTWQYTTDGGATWLNMPSVSNSATLLLAADANTRVRFVPDADWNNNIGPTSLTFRAWDQTTGSAGQIGDATYNGGASAYSAATATSIVDVTPRNDAPVAFSPVGGTVVEGAAPAPILVSGSYGPGPLTATDEASQTITVTFPSGLPAGVELFLADGVTPVNAAASYTLAQFTTMTFRSAAQATPGTFQLSFQLQDNGGTANGGVDRASFSLALTATNQAPVLAGANPMAGIQEDTPGNGTLVADLVAGQVADPTFARGIAVTGVDASHGSWQYTLDGGTTWTALGAPTTDAARLLLADGATRVRFVPAADWSGTATLTFAAWDATAGTAGGVASTRASGGTTAFSSTTAATSITVSPVNDPPVGGPAGALTVAEDSGSTSLGLGAVSYGPGGGGYESGQVLTYTVSALPAASFGRITLADGSDVTLRDYTLDELRGMRFVPAANATGSGSFGFLLRDDGGGADTLAQTVAITITPLNDAPVAGFDLFTATEDTVLTIPSSTLLANDTDVDGDALAVTGVAAGFGGAVTLSNGNVVFTPDADFNGPASFSYTISDGHGGTSITGVVLNVAAVNDAPRLAPDTVSGTEDQVLTIPAATLLGNDTDVEGDAFTITDVSAASGGTVALAGGNVVFTPTANFNGTGGFSYTVTDANGASSTTSVTVAIAAVNDAPVGNSETLTTREDTPLTVAPSTLLANDTDVDGDALAVTGVANGNGGTVALANGSIVFTPDRDFNGTGSFSYTVSDGKGGSANVTVTVDVTPVNDPPVANDDAATATAGVDLTLDASTLLANDSDPENDTLSITGVGNASNGVVSIVGNSIVFVPLLSGTASFTYTVSDGHGGTATGTVRVGVQIGNSAPTAGTDNLATNEDVPLTVATSTLLANDSDANPGDVLTITGVNALAGGTVSLAGNSITFTPAPDFNGAARFAYTVSDGHGGTSTGTVNVSVAPVNDAPRLGADTIAGTEDQPLTIAPATLLGNDRDVEGDAFAITGVTAGSGGSVALANGNIVFTPDANFNGAATFSYTVQDANGAPATATVTVNVAAVNDPPVANPDTLATGEDTPLAVAESELLANDSDVENDPLTIVAVANGTGGTVSRSGGTIVFTPNGNFNGKGSFSYTVSDGQGGASTVAVTVNVAAANDPPVAHAETLSGTEDQALTILPATLLANDTDVDGDALSVTAVGSASGGTVALVDGNIVFTPAQDFNGAASFSYTISDGNGGTATARVTLDLAAVNDAPVAAADTVAGVEDQSLAITSASLLANDSDVDADPLTVTGVANAVGGTVVLSNGDIVFTPTADFHGAGSFSYTVADGRGGSATATVTVNLASVNDVPVAGADAARTAEDTPLTLAPATLLANDSDVDQDPLSIVGVTDGVGGTVAIVDGSIVFTPAADFNGSGSFGYTLSDGQGGTTTGTVTVDVTPVNDAPRAQTDTASGTEDTLVVLDPAALLANDSDADNDTLAIVGVADGSGGSVTFSNDAILFTPDQDFNGIASFTYTVSDGQGGTATGTVRVDIAAVNDAPVAHADVVGTDEDQPLTIAPATLLANDTDAEGDPLTISGVGDASGGTVRLAGGNIVFTPDADFNGPGSFTYTVVDSAGAAATATVTVDVAAVNDAPVGQGETLATQEDTPLAIDPALLLANDADVDEDVLSLVGVASGSGGVVEFSGGSVIFTPDPDFNGTGGFSYLVSDGNGGTDTVAVTVTVAAVNDAPAPGADSVDGVEDTPLAIDPAALLANDSDAEGDALALTAVGDGVGGTVQMSGGTIVFTPDADSNGVGGFSYTVSDGQGGTSVGTVKVNVAAVEDAPVAADDTVAAVEDTALTIASADLLGNDADVDGDALTITSVTAGAGGQVALSGTGIVFTPDADFNGPASFSYTVDDGHGGTSSATVRVDVASVNDAPVAQAGAATVDEGGTVAGRVAATDADVGDSLAYALVGGAAHGSVAVNADGTFTYAHDGSENFSDAFTFEVTDAAGATSRSSVSITVNPVNDAPVAQSGSATVDEGGAVSGRVTGTDPDAGDSLTYGLVGGAAHGSVTVNADGSFTYAHDGSENFVDAFTFEVTDAAGATSRSSVSITVNPANDAPVAQSGSATVDEGGTVAGRVTGTDPDVGDSLTYALIGGATHGSVTVNADGTFSYQHDGSENFSDAFTFEVTDAAGATSRSSVSITVNPVNDAPVAQAGSVAVDEGGTVSGRVTGTDPDAGDSLTYALVGGATHGAVTVNADGTFTYQHDGSENFNDAFTFEVTDAAGATSRSSLSITINPVNDAPVAQSGSAVVAEGGVVAGRVAAIDPDAGDSLTYALIGGATHGSVTVDADGTFTYAHDGSENFTDAFTFEVTDAAGATSRSSVSITINPVNDAPVAQAGSVAVDEGGTVSGRVTGTDPDAGDSLTYTLIGGVAHGSVTVNADGTFSYQHDGSENFTDAFTFEVTDAAGATSRSSVSIAVNPMNDAPVAQAGSVAVDEGGTVSGRVTGTDPDAGDSLTYALVGGVAHGSVTVNADGTFSYQHDGSENFTDAFTFEVTDAAGATSCASVSIAINPVNDAPVAQAGTATVDEGGTVGGRVTGTDADAGDSLTYALVGGANYGSVTVNADGTFTYQHDGSENFSDAFTFEVTDAAGATSRSSVNIMVSPVNDAPVAQSGSAVVDEGGTVSGRVTGTDPDAGDSLTYALIGGASHGSVTVNADGTFTYQHDGRENFSDAFTFEVTDAAGATSRASVSIAINPVNDAPVAQAGTATVDEGGTVSGRVTGTDPDAGDSLTYALIGVASHGSVTVNADGTFTYQHDGSENFSDAFAFEVTDAAGATSRSSVSVAINPVNDAPLAQGGGVTVDEGGTVAGRVAGTDPDVGDSLTYALIGGTTHGSVTVNADGTFSYQHDGSENFADAFTFEVTDAAGATSRSSVSITVNPVNDAPVAQGGGVTVDEGGAVSGRVTATDPDAGDSLTYALIGGATHGSVTVNADGTFTYAHDGSENFTDAFTFEVTDAAGATSRSSVSITVNPVNDAPVAHSGSMAVDEGGTVTDRVSATDPDAGDSLSYALIGGASHGLVTVNADGAFTYQHDGSENFSDAFTFEVTDAAGATSRSSVSITVNPVNDAPVAQSGTAIVDEGGTVSGRVTGIDPDAGDSLAYALVGDASHGSVMVNADGTFTYQHDGSENFTDAFTFEVTDATGATSRSSVSITVNPVNDAPVAQSGTAIVDEGGTVNGRVTGIDPDAGDSLTYALVGGASHGSVTVNADGTFSYEHDGSENFSDAFTFEVTDAAGATSRSSVSITVNPMNDAPVAQAGTATVAEGGTVTAHVTATDADVGDSLTYALIGGATHGSVTVNADGTFSYVHDGSENFTDTFTFQVTDTAGATSRSSVSITVNPVNDAPVAQSGSAAVDEGGTVTGRATATDADVGDTLTYALVGAASHGTATLNPDGIFTYRHDGTETTTDAFTFEVTDAAGATSQATVRITVTPVDDPTVARPDAVQVPEDTTAAGNVLANDSDPDTPLAVTGFRVAGDDTAYAAGASATVAGVGTLRIAADGSYTFTPQADWNGGVPQASYFTNTGATGDLSIVLTAVDDATITAPDAAVTEEGAAVGGNVLANDSDVDSALAIASFRIAGADYAAGTSVVLDGVGTLTLAADGSWFYTPVGDWNGAAPQVAYTTNTGATGVLAIGVTPVNDAPVRTGTLDGLALGEGESAALGFADVSYGPGGGADEAGQTLTVRVTDLPADLGTIVLADGTRVVAGASYTVPQLQGMVFQAAAGVSGSATFSFTVSDDGGGADTLAQQLTVSVANVAPVLDGANALPDLDEDATDNAGMLVGDLVAGHASDPAGNFGIAVVGAASSAGQWQFSRDGGAHWSTFQDVGTASSELLRSDAGTRIRFVPNADWNGTATGLAFRAWDGTGGTAGAIRADTGTNGGSAPFSAATATASITVHAVNDAPQALGPQATVVAIDTAQGEGTLDELAWTYSTGGGRDEAGQSLTVTITALPGSDIGQLVLADGTTSVVLGGHYTPDQLRGARLVVAEGSSGGTAELAWIVRDDGGTARGGVDQATGSVKLAVAPAPATTAPVAPAAPAPAAPQTAAPAPVAQATPAPAPTAPTAAPAVRPGDQAAAGDALVATAPPEALLPPPSGGLAVTPQRADDVRETARILGAGPNLSLDLSLLGVNGQGAAQFEITGLNGLQAGSGRVTLEQFQQSLRSGIFIDELNRLRDQLRQEFDLDKTLSVTVAGLSLGVSVVYVLWLVRGGVLLGSYLSALPAWRLLDPLPVLARAEGEDDEDDDEALDPDAAGRADPLRGFS